MAMIGFALQLIKGRWFMLFASFLIMGGAGGTFVFGTYSKSIKSALGYDQTTLNLLGTFKEVGANIGLVSGIVAEITPTWFVLLAGAVTNFVGYFFVWLAVTGKINHPKLWEMCLFIMIGCNSQNFSNTGVLVTCVNNFPENRGLMLGLLKGFTGLSGAVMTQLYFAVYGNDSTSLILLIAWLPAALSIVFMFTIRNIEGVKEPVEKKVLYQFLSIACTLALFSMIMTIVQKQTSFSHSAYCASASVVYLLLFLPLGITIRQEFLMWKVKKQAVEKPPVITVEKLIPVLETKSPVALPEIEEKSKGSSWRANIFNPPNRGEDFSFMQALLSADMILIIVAVFCGLGANLTAMDNIGQIGESLGYPNQTISTFVSLVSIWNFCGRVFSGFVSEMLIEKYRFPRPLMTMCVIILSCVGHLLIAFPVNGSVYVSSIIIGFCNGSQITMLYTIVSELFGLKHYATLFNCGQLAVPIGSYVFSVKISGMLYDREALKQLAQKGMTRKDVKELTCIGTSCYKLSFIILTVVSLVGAFASFLLLMRTREFYSGDIYKRFRKETKVAETEMIMEQERALNGHKEDK